MLKLILAAALLAGGDTPVDEVRRRAEVYLDQGLPGVFYSDAKDVQGGRIVRLYAVGTAPVRTSLGAVDSLDLARRRAQENAREELVRFLATKVTVRTTSRDEVVITRDGTADGPKETGRAVERRAREVEESASAVLRGLKVAAAGPGKDPGTYVVVYRWEATASDAAAGVRDRMDGPAPRARPETPVRPRRVIVGD